MPGPTLEQLAIELKLKTTGGAKFILKSSAIIILIVFQNVYFRPLRVKVKTLISAFGAVSFSSCFSS